jgi:hypothetical protein
VRGTIRIEPPGAVREVRARLDAIGSRARRPEPALRSRGTLADLHAAERRKFGRRISPSAGPDWVREKRQRGMDARTLRATGKLERALTGSLGGAKLSAYNGELKWSLGGSRNQYYYAAALAARHRTWRVVVIDKPARVAIGDRVLRYIVDGSVS